MRYQIRSLLITITAALLLGSGAALAASNACKADLTGDGVVNFGDLAVLKSVFFQSCNDPPPTCGDDVAQGPAEQCDDGNVLNGDGCSSTCRIEVPVAISRFEDRGLTVFDHQTGLEWEKKTTDASIHDKDKYYSWSTASNNPDGTAFTVFLAALNAGKWIGTEDRPECFAGHCGWRLPSVGELKSIRDCSHGAPCVDPIFGPTQSYYYWSSSSSAYTPDDAWLVPFGYGNDGASIKIYYYQVRAVRGGL